MAALPLRSSDSRLLHRSRSFPRPPDARHCAPRLAELADAPCPFAPVPANRPLALYGAGTMGRLARDVLRTVGRDVVLVVDRNAHAVADLAAWGDARVLHPDDVPDSTKAAVRIAVSVVTSSYLPIEQALVAAGFTDVVPFYDIAETFRDRHPLSNGWFAPPLAADEQDNIAAVLARWNDDVSRAHHLQFLAWRRLREEWTFKGAPVADRSRFFIPEVTAVLHDREVFLDAGAHHGEVTQNFIERTRGVFQRIVAVEPDRFSAAKLEGRLAKLLPGDGRVSLLQCALADVSHNALFHDGLGYASQLSSTGRTRLTTQTIDGIDIAPTFVKLHLEGGELAALKGARQTLLACRPVIAATIYHNADGLWRTPLWLMETLPDYRFLLRLDSWCGTGAVVYAIPNERSARD